MRVRTQDRLGGVKKGVGGESAIGTMNITYHNPKRQGLLT